LGYSSQISFEVASDFEFTVFTETLEHCNEFPAIIKTVQVEKECLLKGVL